MHPNIFLRTFWRLELRPQVFVAMSFSERYQQRFDEVYAPAIRDIRVGDVPHEPYRVDLSKSGDSILTDIMDGVAHSQMVLADVSTVGKDAVTGEPYRNGNVLYEVGIALACRQPSEVLLVRDDDDKFLFDVSTVPHLTVDFSDSTQAWARVRQEIIARLKERQYVLDARVEMAIAGLSADELKVLRQLAKLNPNRGWGRDPGRKIDFIGMIAVPRLLEKQLIRIVGEFEDDGSPVYVSTELGRVVARAVGSGLPKTSREPLDIDSSDTAVEGDGVP